jgi:hypothetical protein
MKPKTMGGKTGYLKTVVGNGLLYGGGGGVKLLTSVDIATRAPWIMLNEQHIVACQIPHELDAQMKGHWKKKMVCCTTHYSPLPNIQFIIAIAIFIISQPRN